MIQGKVILSGLSDHVGALIKLLEGKEVAE